MQCAKVWKARNLASSALFQLSAMLQLFQITNVEMWKMWKVLDSNYYVQTWIWENLGLTKEKLLADRKGTRFFAILRQAIVQDTVVLAATVVYGNRLQKNILGTLRIYYCIQVPQVLNKDKFPLNLKKRAKKRNAIFRVFMLFFFC